MNEKIVGLFGTCGNSKWRDVVIAELEKRGVSYYNPMRPDWTPECAVEEAKHMAEDDIIVIAITGETTGFASLAEVGIALANIITSTKDRTLVVMIEPTLVDSIDPIMAKESRNTRAILTEHIKNGVSKNHLWYDKVFFFTKLEPMATFVARIG